MKSYSSLLLSLIIAVGAASSALAQIELSTGDGNTVKVGPGGIFVQSGNNAVKITKFGSVHKLIIHLRN